MSYRVEWIQSALDELAALWVQSLPTQRQAITQASNLIDTQLAVNPNEQGESRPDDRRIEFFTPLAVTYRVDILNSVVLIMHVWRIGRRSK